MKMPKIDMGKIDSPHIKMLNQISRKIKADQQKMIRQLEEGRQDSKDIMIKMKLVIDNLEEMQANEEQQHE